MYDNRYRVYWPTNVEFCIIDFETTGFNPKNGDRVVEFAFMIVKNGQIIDRGVELVNPNRKMSPSATGANGITNEMLISKPTFDQVGNRLWHAIHNKVLVAHNARFDLRFLFHECDRAGWQQPDFHAIDTVALSRNLITGQANNKLATLANLVGHKWSGEAHRAMNDVGALYSILDFLFLRHSSSLNNLESLLSLGGVEKYSIDASNNTKLSDNAQKLARNTGKKIQIVYGNHSDADAHRFLSPSKVYVSNGSEYVDALCYNNNEERTFKVDRISDILVGETKFDEYTAKGGTKYSGQCLNGIPHGQGDSTYPDGSRYVGEFNNGYRWGSGIMTFQDGRSREGEWRHGTLQSGISKWPDGASYEGDWKEGLQHGFGIYRYPDGTRYEGNWSNGKRDGYGTNYTSRGNFRGEWIEDVYQGAEFLEFPFLDGSPVVRVEDFIKGIMENDSDNYSL